MTPGSLFNVILKIFGLFFLREIINTIPQWIPSLLFIAENVGIGKGIWYFIITFVILAFYTFLVIILLFKSNYIVEKLRLDRGFNQEEFSWKISMDQTLTIALIIIGGIILFAEVPVLCGRIFAYFMEKKVTVVGMLAKDYSPTVISIVKIIFALLIIGERKRIVDFIVKGQPEEITAGTIQGNKE